MPLTRPQIYRRRRVAVFSAVGFALTAGLYLPMTLLAPLGETPVTLLDYQTPETNEPVLSLPSYGASAIGAIDRTDVLGRAGSDEPLPMASITKVITSLVVLDAQPLAPGKPGPMLTFGTEDLDYYYTQQAQYGLVWPVYIGQELSQRDVMNVVLLASANNYAQSLAHWAFGSEEAFVDAASVWLETHGLTGTTLTEASGIQESNRSTATDLTEIARMAVNNPTIAEIVSTRSVEVPGLGTVENRNRLLGIDGVDGIKTGTLDDDWACLLFSADITVGTETRTLVGVVLGGPDHSTVAAAIRQMIADAKAGYSVITITTEGDVYAEYDTPWGDEATAVAAETVSRVVWGADEIVVSIDTEPARFTELGQRAGSIRAIIGEEMLTIPLEYTGRIDDPGIWWRLTNPQELF